MRCADDGDGRLQKVGNSGSFAHELGIHAHAEIVPHLLSAGCLERRNNDRFRGPWQNGAAQDDEVEGIFLAQSLPDLLANWTNMTEIQLSIPHARSTHAKKRDFSGQ